MMGPDQWEVVVAERQAQVRREMELVTMLRQLPRRAPLWRRWAAWLLVTWGGQLTGWGMALSERQAAYAPRDRRVVAYSSLRVAAGRRWGS